MNFPQNTENKHFTFLLGKKCRQKIKDKIAEISNKKIDKLTVLWSELFEPEICQEHMRKLIDHADAFYCDIVQETVKRKEAIEEKIKRE